MRYVVVALLTMLMANAAVARQPFSGRWQGGPATCQDPFIFTDTTYRAPGGEVMKILKVTSKGKDYQLRFKNNYALTLST